MSLKALCRGLLAVAALAASAGSALAQDVPVVATGGGLFFKEIAKDGRIYVFNSPAEAERFEKSGETGRAITKIGVGPNGETVVGDSETALELYFFKHGLSEKVDRPKQPVQTIVWRDGKTRFTLGNNFYMEMSNRIQPRFTFEKPDDNVRLAGTPAAGDTRSSFRIRRAKFKLEGWFYKPELEFEVQLNWVDATVAQPNRFVEDANIDWAVAKSRAFRVRFGQFKAPYGRQQLTSSGAQQFVDRSIVDERYNPGRETGLALWGTLGTNKFDWRAMISNGNGRSQSLNDNGKFLYSGRLQYQLLGNTRMNQWGSGLLFTEGDLGDSAAAGGPLFAIAANALSNDRQFAVITANAINAKDVQYGGDYTFKYRGFASVGEYTHRETKPQRGDTGVVGDKFTDQGFNLQASYAFKTNGLGLGSFVEIAGRYAWIQPDDRISNGDRTEVGGALSYYYNKHNLKVQADYRQLKDDFKKVGERNVKEFRLQTQFIF